MSIKQQDKVWELDLPRNERDVLVILADYADDDGRGARPSIKRIAWKVGISEREVMRCLQWLRAPERKIIEITKEAGFHKPNVYRLFLNRAPSKKPFEAKGDKWSCHEHEWGDNDAESSDKGEARGDKTPSRGDSIVSPDPLSEPLIKPLAEPLIVISESSKQEKAKAILEAWDVAPDQEKARYLLEIEFHIDLGNVGEKRFAALWEEVPIYKVHHQAIYGLLSQKRRRFDFTDYEVTVKRIRQRQNAGMVLSSSP